MSNDLSRPPAAADLAAISASDETLHDATIAASTATAADGVSSTRHARRARNLQKRRQAQAKKRCDFMRDLEQNIDVLIYAELCILYYMDTSFIRLFLRALAQVTFLTPKPSSLPPLRSYQPYVVAIFVPNVLCMLLHLFTAPPAGPEAMRGYVHGGIIMDFIGQKSPVSRFHLICLDLLVLLLQCFMLALHNELASTKKAAKRTETATTTAATATPTTPATIRDLDTEEREIGGTGVESAAGIEMSELGRGEGASRAQEETNGEHDALLADPEENPEALNDDDGPYDFSYTGLTVIGEFHVLQNLRNHWVTYDSPA